MRILGIDPGLRVTGYGVIEIRQAKSMVPKMDVLEAGIVRTDEKAGIAARLKKIYASLDELIAQLRPDVLAIEKLYAHYDHPATAILMGHARGVICLLAGTRGVRLESIPSTQVKRAVTGHGHAGKSQIQGMVRHLLGLRKAPEPPDVADALAVAIAYAFRAKGNQT